jgi:hypothetical protein
MEMYIYPSACFVFETYRCILSKYDNVRGGECKVVSHRSNKTNIKRVYPKVSGLAAWSENCKWYSSLPLGGSCITILWVSIVSFAAITLYVASHRVLIIVVYFVTTQSGNFWIHPRMRSPNWSLSTFFFFLNGSSSKGNCRCYKIHTR